MDVATLVMRLTGAASVHEVAEGHQSRLFEVTLVDGRRFAAKLLDASLVDIDAVIARARAVEELAALDPRVCRPLRLDGNLVTEITDDADRPALLLCSEFAEGVAPDVSNAADAALMGKTLAALHHSMALVSAQGIPEVAALRVVRSDVDEESQLLHGDFNSGNIRRAGSTVKVFDFEDCGYGPRSFELANTLYMVLFASTIDNASEQYRTFEQAFLRGYETEDGRGSHRRSVDYFIDLRVRALEGWLNDVSTAPIGVRTASPEWHRTLRSFVDNYQQR